MHVANHIIIAGKENNPLVIFFASIGYTIGCLIGLPDNYCAFVAIDTCIYSQQYLCDLDYMYIIQQRVPGTTLETT